jgi:hypothetical protein
MEPGPPARDASCPQPDSGSTSSRLAETSPKRIPSVVASIVIDNRDLAAPVIIGFH